METKEILIRILELMEQQNAVLSDLVLESDYNLFQYNIYTVGEEIESLLAELKNIQG